MAGSGLTEIGGTLDPVAVAGPLGIRLGFLAQVVAVAVEAPRVSGLHCGQHMCLKRGLVQVGPVAVTRRIAQGSGLLKESKACRRVLQGGVAAQVDDAVGVAKCCTAAVPLGASH